MLQVDNLSLHFDRPVLEGVSFHVKKGEVIGIVGASGDGKSSLLKIIAGYLQSTSGNVFFDRKKVLGPLEKLIPGHDEIQLVNQDFGLDSYHSVRENVVNNMLYLPKTMQQLFCDELLDLVELTDFQNQQAITLSGGEMQRLSIIRALAREPQVLLLDEPFAHLDVHLKNKLRNYIQRLAKIRKMTCILVSHDGSDVLEWCSQIHFLHKGKIERTDSPKNFYFHPRSSYEGKFFGELNVAKIDGKLQLFRPNEYEVVRENEQFELKHRRTTFLGNYLRHEFRLNTKNVFVLYADYAHSLEHFETLKIRIRKLKPE